MLSSEKGSSLQPVRYVVDNSFFFFLCTFHNTFYSVIQPFVRWGLSKAPHKAYGTMQRYQLFRWMVYIKLLFIWHTSSEEIWFVHLWIQNFLNCFIIHNPLLNANFDVVSYFMPSLFVYIPNNLVKTRASPILLLAFNLYTK